jgi:2,4-dienoyl-CoA reductase-like NADH-dependent reductase (Old Yellow Enzyme family)
MPALFDPITLRHLEIRNRIWVSPMCQYSAEEGLATAWHDAHIGSLATGGTGLIMMEATGVVPEGRISTKCLGLWNDQQGERLEGIVSFAHSQGAKIGIQLAHAGRKGSCQPPWSAEPMAKIGEGGWECVAPSAIAFGGKYPTPRALEISEISELVKSFASAAARAVNSGFDVIEIHAAHGYLFHQFLSPISNIRSDQYGGAFENRIRFLLETTNAIRKVIPDEMPLFVRISASDWLDGGWSIEDSIKLARELKNLGVDLIDVSSGGTSAGAPVPVGPGYQVPFATRIRNEAQIPTAAVGLITEPMQANQIIVDGLADAVMMGREFLRNPRWPLFAAAELGAEVNWPPQLIRGKR